MTAPTTLHIWGTKNHAYCVYRGNIRIHYRSVIGGVMTPPYNALQIISPLNYNLNFIPQGNCQGVDFVV